MMAYSYGLPGPVTRAEMQRLKDWERIRIEASGATKPVEVPKPASRKRAVPRQFTHDTTPPLPEDQIAGRGPIEGR